VVRDQETGPRRDARLETRIHGFVEIEDALTSGAGEVMVPADPGIEPDARPLMDLGQEPQAAEEPEVPVHGGQAHVGQSAPDLGVDPVGGGVAIGRPDHGEDEPPGGGRPQASPGEIPTPGLGRRRIARGIRRAAAQGRPS
jgi:hypothetical protein